MKHNNTNPLPLPVDDLRDSFFYDRGKLYWKRSPRYGIDVGSEAGGLSKKGRYMIGFKGRTYLRARVVWAIVMNEDPGLMHVDHRNNDPLDDRIANLRLATHSQNACNRRLLRGNLPRNVARTASGKYRLQFQFQGRRYNSKVVQESLDLMEEFAELARQELHGRFAA